MTQTLAATVATTVEKGNTPLAVKFEPVIKMTEEQFGTFCELNKEVRIERTAEGMIELMPPTSGYTGNRNSKITTQLENWASQDGSGVSFDSSTGFTLPNGAMRSPDASWISRSRLAALTTEEKEGFSSICPDFVIELRSASDSLSALQDKMEEYMANGARLGWLLDPQERRAYVYRPQIRPEILDNPDTLSAEPELTGFTLQLKAIWEPVF